MRILLVQQTLEPPGGGNGVAAWLLHALADGHEVTTLTSRPWDADRLNAFYGTAIDGSRVARLTPGWPWRPLDRVPGRLDRLRMAVLLRAARHIAPAFDVRLTADGYAAMGAPAIQYLHHPASLHPEPEYFAPLVRAYYRGCDALSGLRWEEARSNITLANSRWTADGLRRDYGIEASAVVYPPVVDTGPGLPWHERPNRVLVVGRFHGSKRLDVAIDIVRRARASVPGLALTLVGSRVDREYHRRLLLMTARDRSWIDIAYDLPRAALNRLMGASRYGLHAMVGEHFGMATAEMARAGCIVFPHASGGSPEVVGGDPDLLWHTPDEAVTKMKAMIASPARQALARARLARSAARFTTERFVDQVRQLVDSTTAPRRHEDTKKTIP